MHGADNTPHAPGAPGSGPAAEQTPPSADGEHAPLLPERVEEIRLRIRDGAYDTADAADEVARRILAAGDA
jgi:hypothetical protein